jgi:hypothetical protein
MQDPRHQPLQRQCPQLCHPQVRQELNMAKHNVSLYRSLHQLRKGNLHRALGVASGDTIPQSKIETATKSSNKHLAQMARFAKTMSGFKH